MAFYSFVEHAATITAIPFSIIGFSVTIWQTAKARSAAEAAKVAAISAKVEVSRSNLLLLIPQLQKAEEELERAVIEDAPITVGYWLGVWRWQASQLRGYLSTSTSGDKKILKLLQSSLAIAGTTKTQLIGAKNSDLAKDTKAVRDAIVLVTTELGALAASQSTQTGDGGVNG